MVFFVLNISALCIHLFCFKFSKYKAYDKCILSSKVFWSMPTYMLSVTFIVRDYLSLYLQSGMPHPGIPVHGWTERGGRIYREGLTGRGPSRRRKYIPFSTHDSRKTCRFEEHYHRHGTCLCNCHSLKLFSNQF